MGQISNFKSQIMYFRLLRNKGCVTKVWEEGEDKNLIFSITYFKSSLKRARRRTKNLNGLAFIACNKQVNALRSENFKNKISNLNDGYPP